MRMRLREAISRGRGGAAPEVLSNIGGQVGAGRSIWRCEADWGC